MILSPGIGLFEMDIAITLDKPYALFECFSTSANSQHRIVCSVHIVKELLRAEQSRRFGRSQRFQVKNPDFCESLQTQQEETFGTSLSPVDYFKQLSSLPPQSVSVQVFQRNNNL